jgi:RNA polymerase sigma-70 factor (ECF subfamily)
LQDVFTALIRDLDRYDESRAPLAPYLYGIARNLSRQRVRRDRRHLVLDDVEEPAGATADPGADMTLAERRVAVRRALAVLPMRYREVIVLCDLHELDYVSAARVLDVPVGTVRSRLHRGRQMLAERLARATDDRRRKAVRAPWRKVW